MNRLHSLDYLRGLAAFGIMVYHLIFSNYNANSFIIKWGVYGVSIFYVLSGLTMYYVYFEEMTDFIDVRKFFIKRLFRIYPLMWLATLITIILDPWANYRTIILNFTGLFGLISPTNTIAPGIWSVGNELFFYLLFPALVFTFKQSKPLFAIITLILFGLYVYFANNLIGSYNSKNYLNPLNQAFLFGAGFLVGVLKFRLNNLIAVIFIIGGLVLFILTPASSELDLMTGSLRLIFTAICIIICTGFYHMTFKFPRPIHWFLSKMGQASYSIYLLHQLVITGLDNAWPGFSGPPIVKVVTTIIITLLLSYFIYSTFEKYFINKGHRITRSSF